MTKYISLSLFAISLVPFAQALDCPEKMELQITQLESDPIARLSDRADYMRKAEILGRVAADQTAKLEISQRNDRSCRYRVTDNALIKSVLVYTRDIVDPDGDEYTATYISTKLVSESETFSIFQNVTMTATSVDSDQPGRRYVSTKVDGLASLQRIGYAKSIYKVPSP